MTAAAPALRFAQDKGKTIMLFLVAGTKRLRSLWDGLPESDLVSEDLQTTLRAAWIHSATNDATFRIRLRLARKVWFGRSPHPDPDLALCFAW